MSKADGYFQFKLCAMSFGTNEFHRLETLRWYCAVDVGLKWAEEQDEYALKATAIDFDHAGHLPEDFDCDQHEHIAAVMGARMLGMKACNLEYMFKQYGRMLEHMEEFEAQYGTDAQVRIRQDIFLDYFEKAGSEWRSAAKIKRHYREFAVLVAIYSALGDKGASPYCIRRETIQSRMMGYKSGDILDTELQNRRDRASPLDVCKIGDITEELRVREFFFAVKANARQTYYAKTGGQRALNEAVIRLKSQQAQRKAERKAQLKADDDYVKEQVKQANAKVLQTASQFTSESPHYNRSRLTEASLIEACLTKIDNENGKAVPCGFEDFWDTGAN